MNYRNRATGWSLAVIRASAVAVASALAVSACGGGSSGTSGQATPSISTSAAGGSQSPGPAQSTALGQNSGQSTGPGSTYLANLTALDASPGTGNSEVNGQNYPESIMFDLDPGPAEASYNLGRGWGHLQATVGLQDDAPENEKVQFQVICDGHTVYSQDFELGQSHAINVNVTGVLRMQLVMTMASNFVGDTTAVWGNASLTR
jgi:NPCBM/NEW2 domain